MKTWPFLLIGFGALLLLIALSAGALHRRIGEAYVEVGSIQRGERNNRQSLNQLRSELYETAILVRDYLLEPSQEEAANERRALEDLRASIQREVADRKSVV